MNEHTRLQQPIPFIDLAAQRRRLGGVVDAAVARVMTHCQFILGPEVRELEQKLAEFCGARHCISVASGTDALVLVLMAKGVGRGDAVLMPAFTYCATAEAAALVGATPVFLDVQDASFNVDPGSIARGVATAKRRGLTPKAVIPVDLFGLAADHNAVRAAADEHKLFVLDDAAQAFGATYKGRKLGTFGLATATSFFPSKPLGCYGDGGAIFTDDDDLAALSRSLRAHGEGKDRSEVLRVGTTGRLDTIQAAVLLEKLRIFPGEIVTRERIAARYTASLAASAQVPPLAAGYASVWAQYTIRLAPQKRGPLAEALKAEGIPTAIYYAKPLHRQPAYQDCPRAEGGLPVTDRLAEEVISLPMHAYLEAPVQDRIIDAVQRALKR